MELAVRQYAQRILLLHLVLLAVVLGALLLASRGIYDGAREQALKQAETRQKLLASQTAAGIANSYRSLMSVMDLVPHANSDQDTEEQRMLLRSLPVPDWIKSKIPDRPADRPMMIGLLLSRQLEGRISHLFIVDKYTLRTRNIQFDAPSEDSPPSTAPATDPKEGKVSPDDVARAFGSFLKTVKGQTVSP